MAQPTEDREQVEQPLPGPTASSTADNSQTATSPVERETNSMTRPAKRQKTGMEEDMRGGTISFVLDEDQHKTLLQLERSFPEWPSRHSTSRSICIGDASAIPQLCACDEGYNDAYLYARPQATRASRTPAS
jgi:hypothetical protein